MPKLFSKIQDSWIEDHQITAVHQISGGKLSWLQGSAGGPAWAFLSTFKPWKNHHEPCLKYWSCLICSGSWLKSFPFQFMVRSFIFQKVRSHGHWNCTASPGRAGWFGAGWQTGVRSFQRPGDHGTSSCWKGLHQNAWENVIPLFFWSSLSVYPTSLFFLQYIPEIISCPFKRCLAYLIVGLLELEVIGFFHVVLGGDPWF